MKRLAGALAVLATMGALMLGLAGCHGGGGDETTPDQKQKLDQMHKMYEQHKQGQTPAGSTSGR